MEKRVAIILTLIACMLLTFVIGSSITGNSIFDFLFEPQKEQFSERVSDESDIVVDTAVVDVTVVDVVVEPEDSVGFASQSLVADRFASLPLDEQLLLGQDWGGGILPRNTPPTTASQLASCTSIDLFEHIGLYKSVGGTLPVQKKSWLGEIDDGKLIVFGFTDENSFWDENLVILSTGSDLKLRTADDPDPLFVPLEEGVSLTHTVSLFGSTLGWTQRTPRGTEPVVCKYYDPLGVVPDDFSCSLGPVTIFSASNTPYYFDDLEVTDKHVVVTGIENRQGTTRDSVLYCAMSDISATKGCSNQKVLFTGVVAPNYNSESVREIALSEDGNTYIYTVQPVANNNLRNRLYVHDGVSLTKLYDVTSTKETLLRLEVSTLVPGIDSLYYIDVNGYVRLVTVQNGNKATFPGVSSSHTWVYSVASSRHVTGNLAYEWAKSSSDVNVRIFTNAKQRDIPFPSLWSMFYFDYNDVGNVLYSGLDRGYGIVPSTYVQCN